MQAPEVSICMHSPGIQISYWLPDVNFASFSPHPDMYARLTDAGFKEAAGGE
jgi:hypothetical protein